MIIYNHDNKDRVVLELEENELTLIAFLIEKSSQKHLTIIKDSLAFKMNKTFQTFIDE